MHGNKTVIALCAALVIAVAGGVGIPAMADELPGYHGALVVEDVHATSAPAGGRSIVRFRIVNDGRDPVHLLDVETDLASESQIVARTSDRETTVLESVGIRADSELDLTTNHMWIELEGLTRAVAAGETFPLDLVFMRGRFDVDAHVHEGNG